MLSHVWNSISSLTYRASVCMPFRWWSNLCTPPWITHSSIFGNGGFALAATMYLSIQLFEIQILNGIFALIQNPLRLRQTSNNESCSKSSILDFRCFLDFSNPFCYLFWARTRNLDLFDSKNNYSHVGPLVNCHLHLVLLPSLCPASSTATAVCCCCRLPVPVWVHTRLVVPLRSRPPRHRSLSILHFFLSQPWVAHSSSMASCSTTFIASSEPAVRAPLHRTPIEAATVGRAVGTASFLCCPELHQADGTITPWASRVAGAWASPLCRIRAPPCRSPLLPLSQSHPRPCRHSRVASASERPPWPSPLALGAATHLLALCLPMSSEEEEPSCCSLVYILPFIQLSKFIENKSKVRKIWIKFCWNRLIRNYIFHVVNYPKFLLC
jgi:hypothetical protein